MRNALPLSLATFILLCGQSPGSAAQGRAIEFPDVPGYRTMVVDLHTHSVFSDGNVWPTIRVQESRRDGLDLMAVTEHLEYQPHEDDIPHPDRNRSFDLARDNAGDGASDPIIVNGAEITRDLPPGHVNAVFLDDANALLVDDPWTAFAAANEQGAFVFWNHPSWTSDFPDGIAVITEMHKQLIADGLMHGIEVGNGTRWSPETLRMALDYDLAILGVSDVHGLIDWDYEVHGQGHRTVTLVFAEERSAESIREALHARRTVAWIGNTLIGRDDVLRPLLTASLEASWATRAARSELVEVTLTNHSDASFELANHGGHNLTEQATLIRVPPHGELELEIAGEPRDSFVLEFRVMNALIAPGEHPLLQIPIDLR